MSGFEEKIIGKDWVMNKDLKKEIDERIEAFKKEIYAKIEGSGLPDKLPGKIYDLVVIIECYTHADYNIKHKIFVAISELIDWQYQVGSGDWVIDRYSDKEHLKICPRHTGSDLRIGFSSEEAAQHVLDRLSDNCKAYLRGEFSR